jgi:hypothetical protein
VNFDVLITVLLKFKYSGIQRQILLDPEEIGTVILGQVRTNPATQRYVSEHFSLLVTGLYTYNYLSTKHIT